jgi:hypothetical protein
MKTPFFALLVFVTVAAGASAASDQSAKAKPVLDKGMDATTIIQLVGQPDEVTPLKSGAAKAETWIYRRKTAQTILQTANTQAFIPAMVGFDGGGMVIGRAVVPQYRLKYIRDYQVTALLLVDGKLQLGRQWATQDEQFAD